MRVVAGDARQPIEALIIFLGSRVAVIRLHQADDVLVEVRPQARPRAVLVDVVLQGRCESASKNGIGK